MRTWSIKWMASGGGLILSKKMRPKRAIISDKRQRRPSEVNISRTPMTLAET
jgi:hypothetical protein